MNNEHNWYKELETADQDNAVKPDNNAMHRWPLAATRPSDLAWSITVIWIDQSI